MPAQAAAEAKRSQLARGQTAMSVSLPGRSGLAAETPIVLSGFAPELDCRWIATTVTHTINDQGYTTVFEGERAE